MTFFPSIWTPRKFSTAVTLFFRAHSNNDGFSNDVLYLRVQCLKIDSHSGSTLPPSKSSIHPLVYDWVMKSLLPFPLHRAIRCQWHQFGTQCQLLVTILQVNQQLMSAENVLIGN